MGSLVAHCGFYKIKILYNINYMKKYKIDNYNLSILKLEEFIKSGYMFDAMKLLKKKYNGIKYSDIIQLSNKEDYKYIIITNNKRLVSFTYNIYRNDLHIMRYVLNINKDILKKIIVKLGKVYKHIMISLRKTDKKLINILLELKFHEWKSMKEYNGKNLDKGYKKIILFNWSNPDNK